MHCSSSQAELSDPEDIGSSLAHSTMYSPQCVLSLSGSLYARHCRCLLLLSSPGGLLSGCNLPLRCIKAAAKQIVATENLQMCAKP